MNPMNKNELTGRLLELLAAMNGERYELEEHGRKCPPERAYLWASMTAGDISACAASFAIDAAKKRIREHGGECKGFKGFRASGADAGMPALACVIFCMAEYGYGMFCSLNDFDASALYDAAEAEKLADWARGAAEDAASDLAYMFTETEPE